MDLSESQDKASIKEQSKTEAKENIISNNKAKQAEAEDLCLKEGIQNDGRSSPSPMLPSGSQLTIFYNGSVSVYDAVTPEKAQAIMLIAAAAAAVSAASSGNKAPAPVCPNAGGAGSAAAVAAVLTRSLSQHSTSGGAAAATAVAGSPVVQPQVIASPNASSLCNLQPDLPIARRHSLQQFLEKRRSRLVSKAPYTPAKKSDEGMAVGVEGKPQVKTEVS